MKPLHDVETGMQKEQQPQGFGAAYLADDAEKMIRLGFIRKVFVILSIQLAVTFGIAVFFSAVEPVKQFCIANNWFVWVTFLAAFAAMLVLICKPRLARQHPNNIIGLAVFTVLESLFIGAVSAHSELSDVLFAIAITLGVSLSLIAFASQTKIDFTSKGMYLYVALWVLILLGIVMPFNTQGSIIYSGLGALLFSMYIVYDAQLIFGGKHKKFKFGVDDYVFAALSLYLDIINLFLIILGGSRRD